MPCHLGVLEPVKAPTNSFVVYDNLGKTYERSHQASKPVTTVARIFVWGIIASWSLP